MVHVIKFRILILVLIVFGLKAKIWILKIAFLYGNIEEEIFMECPSRMTDAKEDDILALNKSSMLLYRQQDSIIRRLWKFCVKLDSMMES